MRLDVPLFAGLLVKYPDGSVKEPSAECYHRQPISLKGTSPFPLTLTNSNRLTWWLEEPVHVELVGNIIGPETGPCSVQINTGVHYVLEGPKNTVIAGPGRLVIFVQNKNSNAESDLRSKG